jgi:hypothetical protein
MLRPHNQVESNHTTQSLVTHCTDNLFGINDPYQPQFHVNRWATGPRELKTPGQGSISAIAMLQHSWEAAIAACPVLRYSCPGANLGVRLRGTDSLYRLKDWPDPVFQHLPTYLDYVIVVGTRHRCSCFGWVALLEQGLRHGWRRQVFLRADSQEYQAYVFFSPFTAPGGRRPQHRWSCPQRLFR